MISKFDLAKALRNKLKAVTDANNYKLVGNGESANDDPDLTYIQEFVLFGDDVSVGLADNSSDIQFGIYQININTPKNKTKWFTLDIVDLISNEFKKGTELISNNQMVRIKNASLDTMMQNETHLIHILSLRFSVIK